ncbi:creatininase family protein [Frankia sp. QA3]|uniref:creatininase family protein n=1 Tax=Frankia sp. QA3 TaxID=710111 RepID=UPI0005632304
MPMITTATSVEVARAGARAAVLPVGSFEQHGAHLPLTTDTLIAQAIAEAVADEYGLLLLPPVTFSCSHEHGSAPGTVSISSTTLTAVIRDIAASLRRSDIPVLVLVNGHGGNYVLSNIVQEANVDGPAMTLFPGRADWAAARTEAGLETDGHDDMHAGELETSILLHAHPDVVQPGWESADEGGGPRPHLLIHGMQAYTRTGVIGRPSLATAEKGKRLLDSLASLLADHLDALGLPGR